VRDYQSNADFGGGNNSLYKYKSIRAAQQHDALAQTVQRVLDRLVLTPIKPINSSAKPLGSGTTATERTVL